MSEHEKQLDEALITQFKDVSAGSDGQKKKESVETLKILYDLRMAQDKANQDSEFRESEMALKERDMVLKETEQKARESKEEEDRKLRSRELDLKEEELRIKELEAQTKSNQADNELSIKEHELELKEMELAVRKAEVLNRRIELGLGATFTFGGMALYQGNVNKIYDFETKTLKTVVAQRALRFAQNFEKLAVTGARVTFSKR